MLAASSYAITPAPPPVRTRNGLRAVASQLRVQPFPIRGRICGYGTWPPAVLESVWWRPLAPSKR